MASSLYAKGREKCLSNVLSNSIGWDSDEDVRVMLVKSTYSFADSDEFVVDLGSNDNGRSASLTTLTSTNGIADAADISLVATSAVACNALVLFVHTGADATAPLLGYIDTATGLPITPGAGATINIVWASTTNKIFKL